MSSSAQVGDRYVGGPTRKLIRCRGCWRRIVLQKIPLLYKEAPKSGVRTTKLFCVCAMPDRLSELACDMGAVGKLGRK